MQVWAAVRSTSPRDYLTDSRIHFLELNLDNEEQMRKALKGMDFDYVVHAAGATKCRRREDFFRINTQGTTNFVNALVASNIPLRKFVYLSSLSIYGAIKEQGDPYPEIRENDIPQPNTAYGESKLQAEQWLAGTTLPYVVLRPTGVYGPREKDYFMMVKSIKSHTDFAVGFKKQDITFVYVADLVQAVFLALEKGHTGRKYIISDGSTYSSSAFSKLVKEQLGNPWVLKIKAPLWLLRIITTFGEAYGQLTGKITALNSDKYNILKQRNWRCDITPAQEELGYKPEYQLPRGVELTVKWYKENGWL